MIDFENKTIYTHKKIFLNVSRELQACCQIPLYSTTEGAKRKKKQNKRHSATQSQVFKI